MAEAPNIKLSSTLGHCSNGIVAVSPDGKQFAMGSVDAVNVYSCSSLRKLATYPTLHPIGELLTLLFSSDRQRASKYLIWKEAHDDWISMVELKTGRQRTISIYPSVEVVSLIWGSSQRSEFLLYVSELEIYVGAYDEKLQRSFTLKGCTLDASRKPLLSISPNNQHICYFGGHDQYVFVYSTKDWTLLANVNAPCSGISPRPIFCSDVTMFVASTDANMWRSVFGIENKTELVDVSPIRAMTSSGNGRRVYALTSSNQVAVYDTIQMAEVCSIEMTSRRAATSYYEATKNFEKIGSLTLQFYREASNVDWAKPGRNVGENTAQKHSISLNFKENMLAFYSPNRLVRICRLTGGADVAVVLGEDAGRVKELSWNPGANCLAVVCLNSVVVWSEANGVTAVVGKRMTFQWIPAAQLCSYPVAILTFEDEEGSNRALFAYFRRS